MRQQQEVEVPGSLEPPSLSATPSATQASSFTAVPSSLADGQTEPSAKDLKGLTASDSDQIEAVVHAAAACHARLPVKVVQRRMQELRLLLPGLHTSLARLPPQLLAQLVADPAGVARRMVQLKQLLPRANLVRLLQARPSLLTRVEFEEVPTAVAKLQSMFPEGGVEELVESQPLLLVAEVDEIVGEVERLVPGVDSRVTLRLNPSLVPALMNYDSEQLSLW